MIINIFISHIKGVVYVRTKSDVYVKFQPDRLVGLFDQSIKPHPSYLFQHDD